MRRFHRPWLTVLLCLATLFNGFAAVAATNMVAHEPCEMSGGHDGGAAPCDDCTDPKAACLQQCQALCAGVIVTQSDPSLPVSATAERVAITAPASFESHAGPPGFQPPR